ncbi:putative zinc finger protein 830-like protein [Rosellinia necatrix]|uniref:Putative zinc finger protein 830-like protein n=1 Tax=Rosellinia necatrix TaxID=77044 RepID=A0A1W2TM70_ROSNE|nr:putative zinc finger protein 830-like protein [Rosellinia necatrix]
MADARALLRAHRAENRIKHPYATYSDAGKLLCKLCHDIVKAESLWDTHIRGQAHRQRLQALQQQPSPPKLGTIDDGTQKRKRGDNDDELMSDTDGDPDAMRAKRSRTDTVVSHTSTSSEGSKEKTQTPPGLVRRTSGTPVHGVEIAIPSRPATPLASSNSAVSTPKAMSATSINNNNSNNNASTVHASSSGAVDEAEWAAFEAEMSALDAPPLPSTAHMSNGASHLYADVTISAPALTAAQLAVKSQEEENERRKHAAEVEMADEREDATRALEAEFEEMEELEDRVRRLKARREKLRNENMMNLRAPAALGAGAMSVNGKENAHTAEDIDVDDDDEEDEEDEWDGFRFRA